MYTISGYYGSQNTPCLILIGEKRNGSKWYCACGSKNVNLTFDEIKGGCSIEELSDVDTFTAGKPIESLEELEEAINS